MDRSQPPGPDGLPVIGNTASIFFDRLDFIEQCAEEYGDIVYRNVGANDSYLVTDPEDIARVLKEDDGKYRKFGFSDDQTERVCGTLVDTTEQTFDDRMEIVRAAFSHDRIASYAETMTTYAEDRVERWDDGAVVDIQDEFRKMVLQITLETLFGQEVDEEPTELSKAFEDVAPRFRPTKRLVPEWIPTPTNYRYKRGRTRIDETLDEFVEQRRNTTGHPDDLLDMLVNARKAERMSEDFLRDELLTMLVASYETTTFALTITWYLLAEHPRVYWELHTELDDQLDGATPTMDDLPDLTYTESVVREALRLYPPVYAVPRIPEEPVEIKGYEIPENSFLFMPQWVVHRDERFYADPEQFRPGRWTPKFMERLPEFAYFPFSGGPRGCVGERFAWVELQLVVVTIAQQVVPQLVSVEPPQFTPGIVLELTNDIELEMRQR